MERSTFLTGLVLVALIALALAGLTWANYQFAEYNPGGNDFIPRWVGVRLLLTEGQDPYSVETTLAIQEAMYGRAAAPGEDQALFAYPLYSSLIFAPFAAVGEYSLARALWMTLLEISLLATVLLAMQLSDWKPDRLILIGLLLFAIAWYHGARPLINGNAAILVALFFVAGLWFLREKQDGAAGLLFALSTIKPQMVLLAVPYALIWAISRRRYRLVVSFLVALAAMLGFSFWLQPNWLGENIAQVLAYSSYTPPGTLASILASWWPAQGDLAGWGLSVFLAGLLLFEWWVSLGKDFYWLLWTFSLTLVLTNLVGIPTTTANYASMLLVIPLVLSAWSRRLGPEKRWLVWLALALLFLGLWLLFWVTLLPTQQYNEHLVMFLPVPLLLLFNLYWLRDWMLQPAELNYPAKRAQQKNRDANQ
ncbi:MAG: glycosyltransferase family 87 protein [Chloroflexi bacterium]|nr:glycosyltransferase family 87 protein [Chloroflexota bacterium]